MKNFNKNLLLGNIRFLANKEGDKTGEVEKSAGVSQGYLSRVAKMDENPNMPLMDLLLWASDKYKVSVDALLNIDIQSMNANENYLRRLFEKLIEDTLMGILSWTSETKNMLENYHNQFKHPLMVFECISLEISTCYYKSLFDPNKKLGEKSIYCRIDNQLFYIIQVVDDETQKEGYETYFTDLGKENAERLILVMPENSLYPLVEKTFNEGIKSSHQINISQNARSIIDAYLHPYVADENLPF